MSGRMIVMTIAMALGLAGAVFTSGRAQTDLRWRGAGGWGPDSNYGRLFNSGTMTTVKGTVKDLETLVPSEDMFKGVTMNVKTDSGEVVPVHLGPEWYIANQDVKIQPKDAVEVRGSQITFNGKPAVIAVTVVKSGAGMLRLRDDDGTPRWSGWATPGGAGK
jgi:hypothetical protein